jgi:4-amino-4-deoxy-L-arabinose transferase-like glycosyltransferase
VTWGLRALAARRDVGADEVLLVALTLTGGLLLVPGLGEFGLWNPGEAELATQAIGTPWTAPLPALGVRLFGMSEASARGPGAMVALLTLLAVAWAGGRLFTRRAGFLAAGALAGFPLFVLQARQLTSDLLPCLGMTMALGGMAELARANQMKAGDRGPGAPAIASAVTAVGLAVVTLGGGVLSGTLPLLGSVAAYAWPERRDGSSLWRRPSTQGVVAVIAVVAAAMLVLALVVTRHRAGQFSWWLGGVPRAGAPVTTAEGALEILGFGLFPWCGLALFALFALQTPAPPARKSTSVRDDPGSDDHGGVRIADGDGAVKSTSVGGERAGRALLAGAALGLGLGTVQLHLVGHATLASLPAVALALGAWLDQRVETSAQAQPLLAFVAMISALLLARDLTLVPEALVSSHLASRIAWPAGVNLAPWVLSTGGVNALGLGLLLGAPPRWPTWTRPLGLALALMPPVTLAFGLAHDLVPALSRHLSAKAPLDHFRELAPPGATLALYQIPRAETGAFNPPVTIEARTDQDVISHLRAEGGGFALVPRPQLAALEARFAEAGVAMAVVDASSSRHLLLAGQLPAGARDQNPLRAFLWHAPRTGVNAAASAHPAPASPPAWADPALPARATWVQAIELVGAEFPARVTRGHALTLTLVFRVRARPPAGQKICVHLELPGQPLFNGDHAPLDGDFATDHWRPGDVIRDVHTFDVPRVTTAAGRYRLLVGWWPGGDAPRLAITSGDGAGSDRVPLGALNID